jgi:hypothetical protein
VVFEFSDNLLKFITCKVVHIRGCILDFADILHKLLLIVALSSDVDGQVVAFPLSVNLIVVHELCCLATEVLLSVRNIGFLLDIFIAAEGYDQQKFVKYICKVKNTTPNVDYFTRDELKKVVREFKDHINTAEDDGITSRNSLLDTSTAKLFDEMMNRRRSSTSMKRRQTLIA